MIYSERLRLRPWCEDDRVAFHGLFNTAAMMRHMGGVAPSEAFDALFVKRLADQTRHGLSYWAVELREGDVLIGSCGLRRASNYSGTPVEGMVEAGWRIAEPWWREGFAKEAMHAALAWGWSILSESAIGTWTTAENRASLALMNKLGFIRTNALDFDRPVSGERCLVHLVARPVEASA